MDVLECLFDSVADLVVSEGVRGSGVFREYDVDQNVEDASDLDHSNGKLTVLEVTKSAGYPISDVLLGLRWWSRVEYLRKVFFEGNEGQREGE